MKVETLVLGQLSTNCYLVVDETSRETAIIDPSDEGSFIVQKILDLQLTPKLIIATHGHFDHLLAATEVKLAFNIPFLIHEADTNILNRTQQTVRHFLGVSSDPPPIVDAFLNESVKLALGNERLEVIETPGHTPGSVSLYNKKQNILFSGDTLFKNGIGRTDFAYGSKSTILASIEEKLFKLPDETLVYPGHGETTMIHAEKLNLVNEIDNNLIN